MSKQDEWQSKMRPVQGPSWENWHLDIPPSLIHTTVGDHELSHQRTNSRHFWKKMCEGEMFAGLY